jgi:imidazolonepropionase-like amidohydrolase
MPTAFVDVSVVPMDSAVVRPHQTVVVDGDRITWIGSLADAVLPSGAQRIDGRGLFLMPGLADMHCHPAAEADLLLCLAYGVTTVRNTWGMPRHLRWRGEVAAGVVLGPDIRTTGPIIEGSSVRNRWTMSASTPAEGVEAVRATKAAGYDAVKVYDELAPEVYQAVVEAAAHQQLPVVGHVPYMVGLEVVLESGQRSIEHLYGYLNAMRPERTLPDPPRDLANMREMLFSAASVACLDLLPALAETTRDAGTWNCPTLLLRKRWQQASASLAQREEMRHQSPLLAERRRVMTANYPRDPNVDRVCALNLAVVKALSDAGAGLLAGTDAGLPTIVFGASLHEELQTLVDAGLSPYQALRASTADAATFLGEAGEWGTVVVGSRADLLLVEGDPLVDVSNASQLRGVMKRGRWLPVAELDERLEALTVGPATAPLRQSPHMQRRQSDQGSGPVRNLSYAVEWSGHLVGWEELEITRMSAGGERLRWNSSIEMLDWCPVVGGETGCYRTDIETDATGTDRAARLEYRGADGDHVIELTRENGQVRYDGSDPLRGSYSGTVDVRTDQVLLASYLTALYARLGAHLQMLEVGERAELALIGPGLPPDFAVATSMVRAERVSEASRPAPGTARYTFEIRRHNAAFTGALTCDSEGLLLDLRIDASPPLTVRRSKPPR